MIATIQNILPENIDPLRAILEVVAVNKYQQMHNISFEDSVDELSRELDIGEMVIRALGVQTYENLLYAIDRDYTSANKSDQWRVALKTVQTFERTSKLEYSLPGWLADSLLLLSDPDQPILFVNSGSSYLLPQFLTNYFNKYHQYIDFDSVEQNNRALINIRLMTYLVIDDLKKIRSSVSLLPGDLNSIRNKQVNFFDVDLDSAFLDTFGTIYVDLISPTLRQLQPLLQTPKFFEMLGKRLSQNGRLIITGPASLLDSSAWLPIREAIREEFQIESIADFSFNEKYTFDVSTATLSFITLRHHQQLSTKQITICSPVDFSGFNKTNNNPLQDLIEVCKKMWSPGRRRLLKGGAAGVSSSACAGNGRSVSIR